MAVLFENITETQRAQEAQRRAVTHHEQQARLFDGVTSTTPDFVYVFDLQGRFLYANRRLLEVWGMQLPDVIGKTCRELGYEQWHHDMHMREIAQVIATKRPIKGEVPFKAPLTGIFGVYEYIFTPVIAPDGEVEIIAGTTRDVTERKRAEEALRLREADLARAQATAHLGSWRWDLVHDTVSWSDELYRIFGVDPATVAPSNAAARERIHPDDRDRHAHHVATALTGVPVAPFESRIVRPGGEQRVVLASGFDVERDATGKPTALFGTILDITERKRMEDELRDADRRKDEFIAMLAHELRNPLAPIRNASYILRHAAPGGEQARRSQDVIERQTQHLARLVDDLLDVTRIARGKIELRRERVDLREIVARAAEDFRFRMDESRVAFRVVIPETRLPADADPTRVAQIIGNLLHNASKFTRPGDEVVVSLAAADGCAEIRVRDTGAGIDPALLDGVFEPFVQADQSLARTQGGLGLGLALVKGVVELHGGTVWAESAGVGTGAEFILRLPLAEAGAALAEDAVAARAESGGRHVLVVDDNRDAAESLADIVRMLGHSADVAFDGPTAIERARLGAPDIVLCDIGLPGMSGYEVARRLRALGRPVQLFAISGYAQPEDVKRAVEAGFDAHIPKPADIARLEQLLT